MKKNLIKLSAGVIIIGSLMLGLHAQAAKKATDFRRTLVVPVGQIKLLLEAPRGMCFIDQSSARENTLYRDVAEMVTKKSDQVLLAIFSACDSLANLGNSFVVKNPTLNVGTVSWLNPSIGERTGLSRQDYLDMREASFHQYVGNSANGLHLDTAVHRTDKNVSLGMTGELDIKFEKFKTAAVLTTTSIRQVPIEVMIRYTGDKLTSLDNIYPLMDKFIAQQIALNE